MNGLLLRFVAKLGELALQLLELILQEDTRACDSITLGSRRRQLFTLEINHMPSFGKPTLRLTRPPLKLRSGHLRIGKFLPSGIGFTAQLRDGALRVPDGSFQGIDHQLEIGHLRLDHRLQRAASCEKARVGYHKPEGKARPHSPLHRRASQVLGDPWEKALRHRHHML
jgi:hypothetical protein